MVSGLIVLRNVKDRRGGVNPDAMADASIADLAHPSKIRGEH
jgi:hypothetical protein